MKTCRHCHTHFTPHPSATRALFCSAKCRNAYHNPRRYMPETQQERQKALSDLSGEKADIAWGSQIRSYVMQPYQMVKDMRTGFESSQVEEILNGKLEAIIREFLRWRLAKAQGTMKSGSQEAGKE